MDAQHNRLTIAHLLLWTATTGVALAYLLEQKPPPAESIGFSSFITGVGQDPDAEMAKAQQRIHSRWQAGYQIGLAASPVYGAALAGAALAAWRVATRRPGFPVQAGHWLLLVICALSLALVARPWLQPYLDDSDGPDFMVATLMAGVFAAAAVVVREPLWRLAIGLGAVGFGLVSLVYLVSFFSTSFERPLFVNGLLSIAACPAIGLICTVVDLAERDRCDVLHWIGVAALFGVVMHALAPWGLVRLGL